MSALIEIPFVTARRTIEIANEEINRILREHRLMFGSQAETVLARENLINEMEEMPCFRNVQADPDDPYKVKADLVIVQPLDNIEIHLVGNQNE